MLSCALPLPWLFSTPPQQSFLLHTHEPGLGPGPCPTHRRPRSDPIPTCRAPEIVQHQRYSLAVDMWSLGVILFILLT